MNNGSALAVAAAFMQGEHDKQGNYKTNSEGFFLFGKKIAEFRNGNLWITDAGYMTNTTARGLNALPGVKVSYKKGVWSLNGAEWNGEWINMGNPAENKASLLRSVAMVAAIGKLLQPDDIKAQNDWDVRMMKAGLGEGMILPYNWNEIPEEEKRKRLDGALNVLKS